MSIQSKSKINAPCKICNKMFNKTGLKNHETHCAKTKEHAGIIEQQESSDQCPIIQQESLDQNFELCIIDKKYKHYFIIDLVITNYRCLCRHINFNLKFLKDFFICATAVLITWSLIELLILRRNVCLGITILKSSFGLFQENGFANFYGQIQVNLICANILSCPCETHVRIDGLGKKWNDYNWQSCQNFEKFMKHCQNSCGYATAQLKKFFYVFRNKPHPEYVDNSAPLQTWNLPFWVRNLDEYGQNGVCLPLEMGRASFYDDIPDLKNRKIHDSFVR